MTIKSAVKAVLMLGAAGCMIADSTRAAGSFLAAYAAISLMK
jgi:hypothetical protein